MIADRIIGWAVAIGIIIALVGLAAFLFPGVRRGLISIGQYIRRLWWRGRISFTWNGTCRDAGLSTMRKKYRGIGPDRERVEVWTPPVLARIRTTTHAVAITVKTRRGQTVPELETGAERLAAAYGVQTYRCWPDQKKPQSVLHIEFVMRDLLTATRLAPFPDSAIRVDTVTVGLTQAGVRWYLKIRGWHTLVVGASGSGKGSILWNIVCGLAPAVHASHARLWGIDLKGGVELEVGSAMFHRTAYSADDALDMLRALAATVDERALRIAGVTRLHEPSAGDPLEVLVIDELASLTAYADAKTRAESNRLLSIILTKGRALGVVVVAFIQDPRKDVIAMRGLFTQTLALRLRTAEETVMVLGEGYSHKAPAHRISPNAPGTCWMVEDAGVVDRGRADYWPDEAIRTVASVYGVRTTGSDQIGSAAL